MRRKIHISLEIALALFAVLIFVAQGVWPFTQRKITKTLEEHFHAKLELRNFHSVYFPHPGCVLDGVVLRRSDDAPDQPFLSTQRLTIIGHYTDFLGHPRRVHLIEADGLKADIAPPKKADGESGGTRQIFTGGQGKPLIVEAFRTSDAQLRFHSLVLPVHRFEIKEFGGGKAADFSLAVTVPRLNGELTASGNFGPMPAGDRGAAHLHANYELTNAQLSAVHGLHGVVHSKGTIDGPLREMRVSDAAEVPDFTIDKAAHPVHLNVTFDATVKGTDGDVTIDKALLRFRHTTLHAKGTVAGHPAKTAAIEFTSEDARIEDLLYVFLHSQPSMQGNIALHALAVLPPEKRKFVERLRVDGDAKITRLSFTHPDTQQKVDKLSVSAQGDPDSSQPPEVESTLSGAVRLRGAVADLTNVQFTVPGGRAIGNGTYSFLSKRVDLRGRLLMDTKLSNATTGIKSILLKPFNGLFKGKHHAAAIGVSMTGTYPHPQYKASLDPDRYKSQTIAKLHGSKNDGKAGQQ